MSGVALVILAAGAGRRLGQQCKALLPASGGASFLETISALAIAAGVREQIVVAGEPHLDPTMREASRLDLSCAINPEPSRGMASSIEVGFRHALDHFGAVRAALLWPVDHAEVRPRTLAAVIEASVAESIVVPVFDQRGGHPTSFGRELWTELARCSAHPDGARGVLRVRAACVRRLEVDDSGVLRDVDTPADRGGV